MPNENTLGIKEIYCVRTRRKELSINPICALVKTYLLIRNVDHDTTGLKQHIERIYQKGSDSAHYIADVIESEDQTRHAVIIKRTYSYFRIYYASVKTNSPFYDFMDKGHCFIEKQQYHFFDFDPESIYNIERYLPSRPSNEPARPPVFHTKSSIMKTMREITRKDKFRERREGYKNKRTKQRDQKFISQYIKEQEKKFRRTKKGITDGANTFSIHCKQKNVEIPTLHKTITSIATANYNHSSWDNIEIKKYLKMRKNQITIEDVFKEMLKPIREYIYFCWSKCPAINARITYNDKKMTIKKRTVENGTKTIKKIWLNKKRAGVGRSCDIMDSFPRIEKKDLRDRISGKRPAESDKEIIEKGIDIGIDHIKILMPLAYENNKPVIKLKDRNMPLKHGIKSARIIDNSGGFGSSEDPNLLKTLCGHIKNTEDVIFLSKYFLERMDTVYKKAKEMLDGMKNITPAEQTFDGEKMSGYIVHGRLAAYFINKETAKVWTYPNGRYICIADASSDPVCLIDRVVSRILALQNDIAMTGKISTLMPVLHS